MTTGLFFSPQVSAPSLFISLVCLLFPIISKAASPSVLIIADQQIKVHQIISQQLKQNFSKLNLGTTIYHYNDIKPITTQETQTKIIIALGINAAKLVENSNVPTVFALLPENTLNKNIHCKTDDCQQNIVLEQANHYAIYLDQPLTRQVNFLRLLLPSAKNIGILSASFSQRKIDLLSQEINKQKLNLYHQTVENETVLTKRLNKLIENVDVLLTLPDPLIHNNGNIPYLLLTTYRYNIPVIGFSKTYVTAGAMAAIYSSPEQISRQIIELSKQILYNPTDINQHQFPPKYFSIAMNKQVAISLDFRLPDRQSIKTRLLQLEQ